MFLTHQPGRSQAPKCASFLVLGRVGRRRLVPQAPASRDICCFLFRGRWSFWGWVTNCAKVGMRQQGNVCMGTRIGMRVCRHVYVYMHRHVHRCTRVGICVYVCKHVYAYTCSNYACICTCIGMHVCSYVCVHV